MYKGSKITYASYSLRIALHVILLNFKQTSSATYLAIRMKFLSFRFVCDT